MSGHRLGIVNICMLLGLGLAVGCGSPSQTGPEPTKELDPSLQAFVLDKLPKTVQHETYLDFGGKVQLLGYDISPSDVAPPGSKISLTLYWQRTGSLDKGWGLFTHILDARGRQIAQYDSSGPLRKPTSDGGQALGPSDWKIGKIYVDELSFEVPRYLMRGDEKVPLRTGNITIAVGVWKDRARLDVIGGYSDAHRRGFVTSLKTGLTREDLLEPIEPEAGVEKKQKDSDG